MDSTSWLYEGFTPLHFAVMWQNGKDNVSYDNTIKTLLDEGASPAARTPQGDTPLHLAIASYRYTRDLVHLVVSVIDDRLFLLEENPYGSSGFSHCHIACLLGKLEIVRSFLDRGVDPNRHRIRGPSRMKFLDYLWHGETCLHVATLPDKFDVVQLLLERGADPNARNASLCTPLHIPSYDYGGRASKLLLEYGADVNARNSDDMTPLHVQFCSTSTHCAYKDDGSVKALLEAGADVNLVYHHGYTALSGGIAYDDRYDETLKLLGQRVLSLREADFKLNDENLESLIDIEELYALWPYRRNCRRELKRMKSVRLDDRTTLRKALHIDDPRRLLKLAANEKFKRIVTGEEFPIYGHLARLQYRQGRRIVRIREAALALRKLYAYITKNDKAFPYECAGMVLHYLTWADEEHVIQAVSL